jgi:HK97 family phage portal protein
MIRNPFNFGNKPKRSRYDIAIQEDSQPMQIRNAVSTSSGIDAWFLDGFMSAGMAVNEKTAMSVSAVYACVGKIGGAIASMPIGVYRRGDSESRESLKNDIWWLLNEQPHKDYSSATFWESVMTSMLLHGDGFAVIKRPYPGSSDVRALEWHAARRVSPQRTKYGIVYTVVDLDGNVNTYLSEDVLHFPGFGFDGLRGMSQLQYCLRTSAGIAMAADTYSAKFFENGARPDFAIVHPGNPTPDQVNTLRSTWAARHSGVDNAHLPAVLAGGMDVKELTMNAEDAQLISTRQFQVEDIARIFGVPPHMIGHTQASTSWGTGIEQLGLGFVKFTLMRHMTVIEKECNRKLWPKNPKIFAEFNPSGLERGDYKTRMEGYRIALGRAGEPAFMRVNEVRKFENLPPDDELDQLATSTQGVNNNVSTPAETAGAE